MNTDGEWVQGLSQRVLSRFASYEGLECDVPIVFCLTPEEIQNVARTYRALARIERLKYSGVVEKFEDHRLALPQTRVTLILTPAEVQVVVDMYTEYMDHSRETLEVYNRFKTYAESKADPVHLYLTGLHIANFFETYERSVKI